MPQEARSAKREGNPLHGNLGRPCAVTSESPTAAVSRHRYEARGSVFHRNGHRLCLASGRHTPRGKSARRILFNENEEIDTAIVKRSGNYRQGAAREWSDLPPTTTAVVKQLFGIAKYRECRTNKDL